MKPIKHLTFENVRDAMRAAREQNKRHALLTQKQGIWSFAFIGDPVVAPEGSYLLPSGDAVTTDEDIDILAASWIEGEYSEVYPLPPKTVLPIDLDEEEAAEEEADRIAVHLKNIIELTGLLPCLEHNVKTDQAILFAPEDGFPLYALCPVCEQCHSDMEQTVATNDAIGAAIKLLGM